jgi:hypothetical protein
MEFDSGLNRPDENFCAGRTGLAIRFFPFLALALSRALVLLI